MTNEKQHIPSQTVPRHVAIIMDGNGRWAQQRGMDRSEGHVAGVTTVRRITEEASRLGIGYLTLYTFSTENWNRPKAEVDALMHLIGVAIERETPDLIANNVQLRMIGDIERMPREAVERLNGCIAATAHCTGLVLTLALSYSARWDITNAMRRIAAEGTAPEAITDETVANHLTTAGMPDPDLLIRTGGDKRISNYLLWEIAYSEISFVGTYWPDYTAEDFRRAINDFGRRERRFGLTSEQVNT